MLNGTRRPSSADLNTVDGTIDAGCSDLSTVKVAGMVVFNE
jgi:hypothetical protein